MKFLGLLVYEQRNRNTPCSLTGDTPVRTVGNHRLDTVLSPGRDPFNTLDGIESLLSEAGPVHGNKPLRCGSENNRCLMTPAVRIGVGNGLGLYQRAFFRQQCNNLRICIEHIHTAEKFGIRIEHTVCIHRVGNFQMVLGTNHIVIHTVTRSSMNSTGTGIGGNVCSENNRNIKIQERMFETLQFKITSLAAADDLIVGNTGTSQCLLVKNICINELFSVFTVDLNQYIFKIRIKTYSTVGRKSPRCCGPYYD